MRADNHLNDPRTTHHSSNTYVFSLTLPAVVGIESTLQPDTTHGNPSAAGTWDQRIEEDISAYRPLIILSTAFWYVRNPVRVVTAVHYDTKNEHFTRKVTATSIAHAAPHKTVNDHGGPDPYREQAPGCLQRHRTVTHRPPADSRDRLSKLWQEQCSRKRCRARFSPTRNRYRHATSIGASAVQHRRLETRVQQRVGRGTPATTTQARARQDGLCAHWTFWKWNGRWGGSEDSDQSVWQPECIQPARQSKTTHTRARMGVSQGGGACNCRVHAFFELGKWVSACAFAFVFWLLYRLIWG